MYFQYECSVSYFTISLPTFLPSKNVIYLKYIYFSHQVYFKSINMLFTDI